MFSFIRRILSSKEKINLFIKIARNDLDECLDNELIEKIVAGKFTRNSVVVYVIVNSDYCDTQESRLKIACIIADILTRAYSDTLILPAVTLIKSLKEEIKGTILYSKKNSYKEKNKKVFSKINEVGDILEFKKIKNKYKYENSDVDIIDLLNFQKINNKYELNMSFKDMLFHS